MDPDTKGHCDGHAGHQHYKPIPEDYGTPIPARTPINYAARKANLSKSDKEAMRKLLIACFVSGFFIVVQVIGGYMA